MVRAGHRLTAVLVSCTLLAVACSGSDGAGDGEGSAPTASPGSSTTTVTTAPPAPDDDPAAAQRLASAALADADPVALVEVFARVGIATYREGTREPVQPVLGQPSTLWLTDRQVAHLALEVHARQGYRGAALDAAVPSGPVPGMSYLLAAYVQSGDTFGSRISKELLAGSMLDDPPSVLFPGAVLALFMADVLSEASPAEVGTGVARFPHVLRPRSVCGDISNQINEVMNRLTDSSTWGGGWSGFILSSAFSLARVAAPSLAELVKRVPFVQQIVQILAVVQIAVTIGSLLRDWTVSLGADASTYHYAGGGGGPSTGAFTATVDTGTDVEPPAALRECAALAGITLPEMSGAAGSEVEWKPVVGWGQHATAKKRDETILSDSTAKLEFEAATETSLDHTKGTTEDHTVTLDVTVHRSDVKKVEDLVSKAVSDAVGIPVIGGFIGSLAGGATGALANLLLDITARASVVVQGELHPWAGNYTQPGTGGGSLTLRGNSCAGIAGPWELEVEASGGILQGSSSTTFTFDEDTGVAPVEWSLPSPFPTGNATLKWTGTATLVSASEVNFQGGTNFSVYDTEWIRQNVPHYVDGVDMWAQMESAMSNMQGASVDNATATLTQRIGEPACVTVPSGFEATDEE